MHYSQGIWILFTICISYLHYVNAGNSTSCLDDTQNLCPEIGFKKFGDDVHCSEFYECEDGCLKHFTCGLNHLFDEESLECKSPESVNCGERHCDNRPCQGSSFTCPDKFGYYPDPKNCMKYYHCENKNPIHMSCGKKNNIQLLYEPNLVQCNWPNLVDCNGIPICDVNDKNCHVKAHEYQCPYPDGYFPDPKNCIKYYQCAGGFAYHKTCPNYGGQQEIWNVEKIRCDWASDASCGNRPLCDKNDENCH